MTQEEIRQKLKNFLLLTEEVQALAIKKEEATKEFNFTMASHYQNEMSKRTRTMNSLSLIKECSEYFESISLV